MEYELFTEGNPELTYTPQDWERPKSMADYLKDAGNLGKKALKFGKDLAICPGTYVVPFICGVYAYSPETVIASGLFGCATAAYCRRQNTIYCPDGDCGFG